MTTGTQTNNNRLHNKGGVVTTNDIQDNNKRGTRAQTTSDSSQARAPHRTAANAIIMIRNNGNTDQEADGSTGSQ
jgi:hypothetical protein